MKNHRDGCRKPIRHYDIQKGSTISEAASRSESCLRIFPHYQKYHLIPPTSYCQSLIDERTIAMQYDLMEGCKSGDLALVECVFAQLPKDSNFEKPSTDTLCFFRTLESSSGHAGIVPCFLNEGAVITRCSLSHDKCTRARRGRDRYSYA